MTFEAAVALSISREHFATTVSSLKRTLSRKQMLAASPLITASLGRPGTSRLPLRALDDLLADLRQAGDDPLLLVKAYSTLNYSPGLLRKTFLASAFTRRDAVRLLCRYFLVNTQGVELSLHDEDEGCVLQVDSVCRHATAQAQREAIVYGLVRTLLGLGVRAIRHVTLGAQPASVIRELEGVFPVPVQPGTSGRATIVIAAPGLDDPLGWPACSVERIARRERHLLRLRPDSDWNESVSALLPLLCREGEVDIDQCAGLLAVSRRTLQRHLGHSGAVFRDLLELSRRDQAKHYLARQYGIDEVALLLGYRQSAQFYRAFRQWHGCSPVAYRNALAGGVALP